MNQITNNMEVRNLEQAKALVKRYREITYDDVIKITEIDYITQADLEKLTGFGFVGSCRLCIAVDCNCDNCIYATISTNKSNGYCMYDDTYSNISNASSITELLIAYKKRANYLEGVIKSYELNNNKDDNKRQS